MFVSCSFQVSRRRTSVHRSVKGLIFFLEVRKIDGKSREIACSVSFTQEMLRAISSLSCARVIANILKNGLTTDSFDPEFLDDSCHCISCFALSKFNIYI